MPPKFILYFALVIVLLIFNFLKYNLKLNSTGFDGLWLCASNIKILKFRSFRFELN